MKLLTPTPISFSIVNNQDIGEANKEFNKLVPNLLRVLKKNDDDFNALYIKYMKNPEFKDNFNSLMQSIVNLNQEAPLIDGLIDDLLPLPETIEKVSIKPSKW